MFRALGRYQRWLNIYVKHFLFCFSCIANRLFVIPMIWFVPRIPRFYNVESCGGTHETLNAQDDTAKYTYHYIYITRMSFSGSILVMFGNVNVDWPCLHGAWMVNLSLLSCILILCWVGSSRCSDRVQRKR